MFGFRPNQAVEAPPNQYAAGPTQTGKTTELDLSNLGQLTQMCQALAGPLVDGHAYYQGCYVPSIDQVLAPARGAWPSEDERQQIIAHEWAHARGWRHNADGAGTSPTSLPPVQSPTQPTGLIGSQYPLLGSRP